MSNAQRWQNRIVGHGEEAPDQLLAHPLNFRIHPTKQKEALAGAIEDVGFIRSVTVNRLTGRVIDGHLRVALAIQTGQPSIPVEYVELSESEEAEALATLDPLAALAATDAEQLDALLREVQTGNAAVQAMLAELAEAAGLYQSKPAGAGGDEFDTTPDEEQTRVKFGDLWQLGEHRVICGDSTDRVTIDKLMDGESADAVFTSPPYLQQRTYENNMVPDWHALMVGAFGAAFGVVADGAQVFVNLGLVHREGRVIRYWDSWIDELEGMGWPLFGWYVWDKLNGMPGDWNGRLAPAHEWIFHFTQDATRPKKIVRSKRAGEKHSPTKTQRKPDGTVKSFTSNDPVSPFKIPDSVVRLVQHQARGIEIGHPAIFPISLPSLFVEAYQGNIWFDPFGGSGTTLIACERTGRKARLCEIEPKYCNIILARWEAETGREAVLVERLDGDNLTLEKKSQL